MRTKFQHSNLLFAELDVAPPENGAFIEHINALPQSSWVFNPYRNASILALRNQTGGTSGLQNQNKGNQELEFHWTELANTKIRDYFQENIFPWTDDKCRVVIFRTPANVANHEHIDCSRTLFGTIQHKLRIVLQGHSSSLYFLTDKGRVHIPNTDRPFIIDGSWPHGMINDFPKEKLTICLGAPWTHSEHYPDFRNVLTKDQFKIPANFEQFFESN